MGGMPGCHGFSVIPPCVPFSAFVMLSGKDLFQYRQGGEPGT
jgi:hypothetical protein